MQRALSQMTGYAIDATDGRIGTVSDVLFDDATWKVRWIVVDTGHWLTGRKVLIHPSAIGPVDDAGQCLSVALSKARIEGSPDILHDQPVSRQMESGLYGYYGWNPGWGGSFYGMGAIAGPFSSRPYFGGFGEGETARRPTHDEDRDPHLRSLSEVHGYHIHATDGDIGHIEDLVTEDGGWGIRYLVVDTRNWWPGQHVLISPFAVRAINWGDRQMRVDITRAAVKASPPWTTSVGELDPAYQGQLHGYYGWPGYML